ncbi:MULTISPECIES: peptidoglycan DD-metalloendopeptidase family protein [unclassified Vibrio]|uniref:Peptidoglycan DD-metalloendopeptidase family protein n=1 Tax=Vibrio sp. HB236076 TaxID=3232307 RepID=A0AB39HG32_9VIBR|nr:peptidoglycan DD-metalloendopeptidase family protein [Vibrio sp. HB161653]MDP5254036.1 peptidoglycan DD-metalloendopeptidase family protein [Vibrio sp. HB161653]
MKTIFNTLPRFHRIGVGFFSALIFVACLLPDEASLSENDRKRKYVVGQRYSLPLDIDLFYSPEKPVHSLDWQHYQVQPGESTALLFKRIGLSPTLLYRIMNSSQEIKSQLSNLRPGDKLAFGFDQEKQLTELRRGLNQFETFVVVKGEQGYQSRTDKKHIDYQYNYTEATITSNFWNAAISANLTPNQIMAIAGMFGWDIDFALDIRQQDSFKVLYQDMIVEGEVVGKGKILAATFTNQGDTFTAILDENSDQYFDKNGRAMKKAFLRAPIDFRRVSSNFNPKRLHPVTGLVKPHRGTDYVAPVGTPIWAAGDGVVQKAGYNRFNGNYVFIRHSNTYITKYLHMKKRLVNTGQRVKQGQTIGTLGSTGRVTGAHLHYEFLVNGVHKNPRTVDLPLSKSLQGKAKATFIANANLRLQKLEQYQQLLSMQ